MRKKNNSSDKPDNALYEDLSILETESAMDLATRVGGTNSVPVSSEQDPLTAGLRSHLETGTNLEINNQVAWVEKEIKSNYTEQVEENYVTTVGGEQVTSICTASAEAQEAVHDLQNYLQAHHSVLDANGIQTFVHNWETDLNNRSMQIYENSGTLYSDYEQMQGVGQQAARDWQAVSSNVLGENSTAPGAQSPAEWGQGYVTGGLQMHGDSADSLKVASEVEAIYSDMEQQDKACGGQFQPYIQQESEKLMNVLDQEGHLLTSGGARQFDINLDTAMADSAQLHEAGINGSPNIADFSNLNESTSANYETNKQVLSAIESDVQADYDKYGNLNSQQHLTTSEFQQQALSAELNFISNHMSVSLNDVKALTTEIENADGITLAHQVESLEARVGRDESAVSQFIQGSAEVKALANVDQEITGEAIGFASGAGVLTAEQRSSILQNIEDSTGITTGHQVLSMEETIANEAAGLVRDGVLTTAQEASMVDQADELLVAEVRPQNQLDPLDNETETKLVSEATANSGITGAIQVDALVHDLEAENKWSANYNANPPVSSETILQDAIQASNVRLGIGTLNGEQIDELAAVLNTETGIGAAVNAKLATESVLNEVSKYGAFDHKLVEIGEQGGNIEQVVRNFVQDAEQANPSENSDELAKDVEHRLRLDQAKSIFDTAESDIAADQQPLFESKYLKDALHPGQSLSSVESEMLPDNQKEAAILRADALLLETSNNGQPISKEDLIGELRGMYDFQSNTISDAIINQIDTDAYTKAGNFWSGNMTGFNESVVEAVRSAQQNDPSEILTQSGQEKLMYTVEKELGVLAGEQNVIDEENPIEGAIQYLDQHPVLKYIAMSELEIGMGCLTVATLGAAAPAMVVADVAAVATEGVIEVSTLGVEVGATGTEAAVEDITAASTELAGETTVSTGATGAINSAAASLLRNMTSAFDFVSNASAEDVTQLIANSARNFLDNGLTDGNLRRLITITHSVSEHLWDYQTDPYHMSHMTSPITPLNNQMLGNSNLNLSAAVTGVSGANEEAASN